MRNPTRIHELLGRLMQYPDEGYVHRVRETLAGLERDTPQAAARLRAFHDRIADFATEELEELFTRTFDLNPVCALEVGWQLYGEEYTRGAFLVFVRGALRRHEIAETAELPDHLTHVLPLLDRLPEDEASELARGAVLPALKKMLQGLNGKNSPYEDLLLAVREQVERRFQPEPVEASHA